MTSKPTGPPPIVLLLLDRGKATSIALAWAVVAARASEATVYVILVRSNQLRDDDVSVVINRMRARSAELSPGTQLHVEIVTTGMRSQAVRVARTRRVDLAVLSTAARGEEATAIAEELQVPVLIARAAHAEGPIVAATDLRRPDYPVLSASSAFARLLRKPLTFFHNVTPMSITLNPLGAPSYIGASGMIDESTVNASRLRMLADAAGDVEVIVSTSCSTVDTILRIAQDRNADIVTVGHRRRSWFGRMFGRHVPAQLVDRCLRNVLIIPVGER